MNYEQFLEQMKEDLQARFTEDLPPELADVRIGIGMWRNSRENPTVGFLSAAGTPRSRQIST